MIHGILAAITCTVFILCGLPWPSCLLPAAFYLGREVAQSEYRYINTHGGKRAACPWYCGFIPEAWTAKSVIDCLFPLVVGAVGCVVRALVW